MSTTRNLPLSNLEAILAILDEHGVRLYTMLLRLTLRTDVADDLMQDLFCKVSQDPRCLSARDPAAYVVRTAVNLALDYRRGQRRAARDGGSADTLPAPGDSPLDQLVRREELDQVLDAVSQLSSLHREVVVLRYIDRQDYPTIARQLDKTPHQVRAICHKAISGLRVALAHYRNMRTERSERV